MQKDIFYAELKKDQRAYAILLLRDQEGASFTKIAKKFGVSATRAMQKYNEIKMRQSHLYINHIAFVLGHENSLQIARFFAEVRECYYSRVCACAYFEQQYDYILTPYRAGEPGMPKCFIKKLPPFTPTLSKSTVAKLVELRETQRATYAQIAAQLQITKEKAKAAYEGFYHQKTIVLMKALLKKVKSTKEKRAIYDDFLSCKTSKKQYETLMQQFKTANL